MIHHGSLPEQALVVHCKSSKYDVYIGRPGKWGNPFMIGRDGDRATVIRKYEAYLLSSPALMASVSELKGKVLGCWCAPCACHGDVLARIAREQALVEYDYSDDLDDCANSYPELSLKEKLTKFHGGVR